MKVLEIVKSVVAKFKLPSLEKILSEPDGTPSWGRYSGFIMIMFAMLWTSYIVIKTKVMPDLENVGVFVLLGSGSHYGVNQAKKIVAAIKGKVLPSDVPENKECDDTVAK